MSISNHNKLELKALKLNISIAATIAFFGLFVALYSRSIAVFIDAGYTFVGTIVYILAFYAVKKIQEPPDSDYPYGYAKLEPIVINIQCLLVISIALVAISLGIIKFVYGAAEVKYHIALIYTLINLIICAIMYSIINRAAKKTGSKILLGDAALWKADTLLSVGVLFGLFMGFITENTRWNIIALYTDPLVAFLIALYIVYKPIKLLKESMLDLLDANPGGHYDKTIREIVHRVLDKQTELQLENIKIVKAGRKLFVDIGYKLPSSELRAEHIKHYGALIEEKLTNEFDHVAVAFFINHKSTI